MSPVFLFTATLALAVPAMPEPVDEFVILADDWARPRSGERIMAMPAVQAAVTAWLAAPERLLILRHAGGENGILWASEIRDWLVTLGLPADAIALHPGGLRDDAVVIQLEVMP